jgi:hypothetical protein
VYNVALFFHLFGALLFVAGIVLAGAGFELARRQETPAEVALLLACRGPRTMAPCSRSWRSWC